MLVQGSLVRYSGRLARVHTLTETEATLRFQGFPRGTTVVNRRAECLCYLDTAGWTDDKPTDELEKLLDAADEEVNLSEAEHTAEHDCEAIEDGQLTIDEASKMDPFKRKSSLGPGPRGVERDKRRSDRYKCRCSGGGSSVKCKCRSASGDKTVEIPYEYKRDYNAEYKKWAKKRRR